MMSHELTHVEMTDGSLTPACMCGWYSHDRSHLGFEGHLRRALQREQAEVGWSEHTA